MAVRLTDKILPLNDAFIGMVDANQTIVDASGFSGNLSIADTDLQTALQTIDEMAGGTEADPFSLHLNQVVPQTIINGAPQFDEGIVIKANKWVYLDGV
jgi:hypothetical protein